MKNIKKILAPVYGDQDLAAHPFFLGGYINFGYWDGIPISGKISIKNRIKASQVLYQQLLDLLELSKEDRVVEIACGHGLGSVMTVNKFQVKKMVGVDITPEQIQRARKNHQKLIGLSSRLSFQVGQADRTGLKSKAFTKMFSLEAAQHFPSIENFLKEAKRILKKGGRLGICTFFPETRRSLQDMKKLVPQLDQKMHPMLPIDEVLQLAIRLKFKVIRLERIGQQVFPGFDQWIKHSGQKEEWGHVWLKAYQHGLMDYFNLILEV